MDNWFLYKNKQHKKDLKTLDIPKTICYGNMLLAQNMWLAANNKIKQKHINKFFDIASLVLQATMTQKGFSETELMAIHQHIERITKDLLYNATLTAEEIGLMLGNLSEIENGHYTFIELIGFMRAVASKI